MESEDCAKPVEKQTQSEEQEKKQQKGQEEEKQKEPGKKKKTRILLWVLVPILLAAAVAAGMTIYERMPQQRYARQMEIGQKYLNENQYEEAVAAFTDALEILPDDEMASEQLETAYIGWSDSYVQKSRYQDAVGVLQRAIDAQGKRDGLTEALTEDYLSYADSLIQAGNYDGAEAVLKEAAELVPGDAITQKQEELLIAKVSATIRDAIQDSDENDFTGSDEAITAFLDENQDILIEICDRNDGRYVSPDAGFGIYRMDDFSYGGYCLYLGSYSDGSRDGSATWIWFDNEYGPIAYYGTWSSDAPNGPMTVSATYSIYEGHTRTISGNMTDGLWNGAVTWAFIGDTTDSYDVSFSDGLINPIKPDTDSGYIVSESSSGTLVFGDEECAQTWGAPGFAQMPW